MPWNLADEKKEKKVLMEGNGGSGEPTALFCDIAHMGDRCNPPYALVQLDGSGEKKCQ